MNIIRLQGLVFCGLTLPLMAASLSIHTLNSQTELIVLGVLIMVLGVPHGALDTIFAKQLYNIKTLKGWLGFFLIYLVLALSVIVLWQITPIFFLIGFLVVSIFHFSGDPVADTPVFSRIIYGGTIIVLPTLLHSDEVARLFSFLSGVDAAQYVTYWLHILSRAWLLGILIAVTLCWRRNWQTAMEISSVALIAVVMPPLQAFTLFFCAMHSARHILRTLDYSGKNSFNFLILAATMPMLMVAIFSFSAWYWLRDLSLDSKIIQLVFVGLAAFTVPHMALVERVRLSGWIKGAARTIC